MTCEQVVRLLAWLIGGGFAVSGICIVVLWLRIQELEAAEREES
jgi:hypothetical protein